MSSPADRLALMAKHVSNETYREGFLKDEVAIITGGAQGIGRATALLFAAEGAKVVIADLDATKAQKVVEEIRSAGRDAIAVVGNLMEPDFPKHLVKETIKAYGNINHIVNNAGFAVDKMLHQMTDKDFEVMLNIHNLTPFRLIREAAPYFRKQADTPKTANRSIINVSSQSGIHGQPGQVNYATAKMGLVGMTKTIAQEWGRYGVRCNSVAFGTVTTRLSSGQSGDAIVIEGKEYQVGIKGRVGVPQGAPPGVPLARRATPEEAAASILMLASPFSAYITGIMVEVAGGRLL